MGSMDLLRHLEKGIPVKVSVAFVVSIEDCLQGIRGLWGSIEVS